MDEVVLDESWCWLGLNIVDLVKAYSLRIHDGRTRDDIFRHAGEELGELSVEISIAEGKSYKKAGKDGIIGESVDLILCALDQIFKENPDITQDDILNIAIKKCDKWEEKVNFRLAKDQDVEN